MRGSFVLLVLALTACSAQQTGITVDLRTDYTPGDQFVSVRTELATAPFTAGTPPGILTTSHDVASGDHFLVGARVAEQPSVTPGSYYVRVSLVTDRGTVLASRVTVVDAPRSEHYALVTTLTRSCETVRCPAAGGSAAATECDRGHCVEPTCSDAHPEACSSPQCRTDPDCATDPLARTACASASCVDGACLFVASDARCAPGERCRGTDLTCVAVAPPADAGPADAGARDTGGVDAAVVCDANHGDCDGNPGNGCETDLRTSVANCGACNTHPTEICDGVDNTCEGTVDEGCHIPVHRAVRLTPFIAYRYTTDVALLSTDGYSPEAMNVFYVNPIGGAGSDGLYECQWTTGGALLTRSPTCEDHPETGTITQIGQAYAPTAVGTDGCVNTVAWWHINPGAAPSFFQSLSTADPPTQGTGWMSDNHELCVWQTP